MIQILRRGLLVLTTNTRLWVIFILIIIFPLLFVIFYTSEARMAEANLESSLIAKVSTIQDVLEIAVKSDKVTDMSQLLIKREEELVKMQIVKEEPSGLVVVYDAFGGKNGRLVETPGPFKSALIEVGTTMVYPYQVGDLHLAQAFRALVNEAGETSYIFTEHDFTATYNLLSTRTNKPLLYLALIFIFIICLTYWLIKQINYQYLYEEQKKTLKERDLFMNSLVHELRSPLTAMRGYASMIEEANEVPKSEQSYARRIRESTTRLVVLINDFLEAARVQSGQLAMTWARADLKEVVTKVINQAELPAREKGLVLKKSVPDYEAITKTDVKRLEQAITNVLSNAIKYTPDGTITVLLEKNYKSISITVADTGRGISADDQKKIFSPFVRVGDRDQLESVTGTGLGMWITRSLIEQLGGKIELESIKGVGTHVIVTIPLKD